ncbi:general transcription factor IIF subunit 2-like isoform X2 [Oculina patagonica]
MGSEVDCSGVSRAVWLVKVPKYLSNIWMENTDASGIVGSLQITNNPQRNEVAFQLSDALANKEAGNINKKDDKDNSKRDDRVNTSSEVKDKINVPKEYKMVLSKVEQSMGVFSEGPAEDDDEDKASRTQVTIEGVIAQRADCRPVQPSADYMKLKKRIIVNTSKAGRQSIQVDRVIKYRPVSDHKMNIEHEKKKKEEGKRAREDEDVVKALLFSAFERHQYYNLKDLITITKQPVAYLKGILKEIGHYNTKNPHKNMWELKPEYRHYSNKNSSEEGQEGTSS